MFVDLAGSERLRDTGTKGKVTVSVTVRATVSVTVRVTVSVTVRATVGVTVNEAVGLVIGSRSRVGSGLPVGSAACKGWHKEQDSLNRLLTLPRLPFPSLATPPLPLSEGVSKMEWS